MLHNAAGGRPSALIIRANFTIISKVDNKSGRYWYKCNHCPDDGPGAKIQGRDNNHVKHLMDPKKCPNAPTAVRKEARVFLAGKGVNDAIISNSITPDVINDGADSGTPVVAVRSEAVKKRKLGGLDGFVDHALTAAQQSRANVKLFRFIVHANIAFSVAENWYFQKFLDEIRPSYSPPSRFVLSHSIMDSEVARVQVEEIARIKGRKRLTLLIDGWEDKLRRSLYGSVASEVNQYPVVLSLEDMTGHRGTADKLLETSQKALKMMEIEDGRSIVATTTDNPTTMQAFRRKFQEKYFWVLTFACFLHGLNTIIGEIVAYPDMKKVITKCTRIVTFFNSSHYWGGQLKEEAKAAKVTRGLKKNCETRWYALVLQALSVKSHRIPLQHICLRPDAVKKMNGLSPVSPEVIQTVLHDQTFWIRLNQLIKTAKPIVDAIGNLESREASLADCMLELIRCARALGRLQLDSEDDDTGFWMHSKSVFNRRFHAMNTRYHSFALFLHPMCRKLAISQAANGRSFEFMVKVALDIAKQWRWNERKANQLIEDLKQYYQCKGVFAGGQANGLDWWECLPVTADAHPLKALAIVILSIVPHAADVERLFSALGGTQTVKRCNLAVDTFENLGKLRANYSYHLQEHNRAAGKATRRHHAHMHTSSTLGINTELADELRATFSWVPPLATGSPEEADDYLQGPEDISLDELDEAFSELEKEIGASDNTSEELKDLDGNEVLEGEIYEFKELDRLDKGLLPMGFEEEVNIVEDQATEGGTWDIDNLMSSKGVSSL